MATFEHLGLVKIGIVHDADTRIFDLRAAALHAGVDEPAFHTMLALIDAGSGALAMASEKFSRRGADGIFSIDLDEVRLLAPVPVPRQMRDGMLFP